MEDLLCRKCGQPVKRFRNDYDVFEQMHWLCFHLEFEHGDYDPDEPCDDPSCPWNRIKGIETNDIEEHYDFMIQSQLNSMSIQFSLYETELKNYPSICLLVKVRDNILKGQEKKVWFEFGAFNEFVNQIKELNIQRRGKACFTSMSPNDFEIIIENVDSLGHFICKYTCSFYSLVCEVNLKSTITSGFELEPSTFDQLEKSLNKLIKSIKE